MRRLLALIPRDRTLLLLIAPVVALVAIAGASLLDRGPTPATVRSSTSTTAPSSARPSNEVAEGTGQTGGPSAPPAPSDGPDLSAGGNQDYQGDPAADVGGADLGAPLDTGAPAPEVLGATTVPVSPTTTVPPATTTTAPTTVPTTVPGTTTVPPATTTTVPVTSTTVPGSTTTTTVPGPPPVVSESPVAALIPVSAVVAVGLAVGLLYRRRRRGPDSE